MMVAVDFSPRIAGDGRCVAERRLKCGVNLHASLRDAGGWWCLTVG